LPTSQRRALQQLSAFAGVGALPAPQIGEMDLDFTERGEGEDVAENLRSNSRSKTVQIN
jgi:hypothetical protein